MIAAGLVTKAHTAGMACRAVVADCSYGYHDDLRAELRQGGWGFVMALKPARDTWQYGARRTPRRTRHEWCPGTAPMTPV
ncbi:hypothetical protein GCM10027290_46460 [Micromonospora sonneratiae]